MKLGLLPITGIIYHDFLFFFDQIISARYQSTSHYYSYDPYIPNERKWQTKKQKNRGKLLFPIMSVSGR